MVKALLIHHPALYGISLLLWIMFVLKVLSEQEGKKLEVSERCHGVVTGVLDKGTGRGQ